MRRIAEALIYCRNQLTIIDSQECREVLENINDLAEDILAFVCEIEREIIKEDPPWLTKIHIFDYFIKEY